MISFPILRVDERNILMVSIFILAFGYYAMMPMTDDPPEVTLSSIQNLMHIVLIIHFFSYLFRSLSYR